MAPFSAKNSYEHTCITCDPHLALRRPRDLTLPTYVMPKGNLVLRGGIVNRTYGIHNKVYVSPFLLTIFRPINYGPP